mmetsp:Transcript_15578/g.37429  ORF Transcript_15578/g.37429 Transcript_15578/m.37429 type:complete len:211 (+) Transcript_15578:431-1063(+)
MGHEVVVHPEEIATQSVANKQLLENANLQYVLHKVFVIFVQRVVKQVCLHDQEANWIQQRRRQHRRWLLLEHPSTNIGPEGMTHEVCVGVPECRKHLNDAHDNLSRRRDILLGRHGDVWQVQHEKLSPAASQLLRKLDVGKHTDSQSVAEDNGGRDVQTGHFARSPCTDVLDAHVRPGLERASLHGHDHARPLHGGSHRSACASTDLHNL